MLGFWSGPQMWSCFAPLCPRGGACPQQSLARGKIVAIPVPRTIADGAQTRAGAPLRFALKQVLLARSHPRSALHSCFQIQPFPFLCSDGNSFLTQNISHFEPFLHIFSATNTPVAEGFASYYTILDQKPSFRLRRVQESILNFFEFLIHQTLTLLTAGSNNGAPPSQRSKPPCNRIKPPKTKI